MALAYLKKHGRLPNLKNPQLFSEKILWAKLFARLEEYSDYVDKYAVRSYVEKRIGSQYLNKLIGVYSTFEEIDFDALPDRFVLKATHGCGMNYICRNKSDIVAADLKNRVDRWLKTNWYEDSKEKQYQEIVPRLICEKYLEDASGGLMDYKFFCFNSKVEFIKVFFDRGIAIKKNIYTPDWKRYDIHYHGSNSSREIAEPECLKEMVEIAGILSSGFPFVRVDLYLSKGRIYFGELTFTPAGGIEEIYPREESLRLAAMIDLELYPT